MTKISNLKKSKSTNLLIILAATFLFLTCAVLMSQSTIAYGNNTTKAFITCQNGDVKITNVNLSLYREQKNQPIGPVTTYYIDEKGYVSLTLAAGQYGIEAYSNGESGFHGYTSFTIKTNSMQKSYQINIEMKKNSDHSSFIDLTPTYENAKISSGEKAISVISEVSGKEGKSECPIFTQNLPTYMLDKIKSISSLNSSTLNSPIKSTLTDIKSNSKLDFDNNRLQLSSTGDIVSFDRYTFGVVTNEIKYDVWHPVAVIDSENGLTHQFHLSICNGETFTISSEIEYNGVSASASYSHQVSKSITFQPITVSNGAVKTYRSEFEHVYQEGDIYYTAPLASPVYIGSFQREYIDEWYSLSFQTVNHNQMGEVRDTYLGEWRSSCEADVVMTESTQTTGSIGFEVERSDIFGSVQLSVTFKYDTKAFHHFTYNQPATYWYVKFYRGRAFDINTYQYYGGNTGGGCPVLSVYNGSVYANEGLLNIHVQKGYPDVTFQHLLINNPQTVHDKYLLRLIEHQKTQSFIDMVQLWAILDDGSKVLLPLSSAIHSTYGNVKRYLLFSDEIKIDEKGADLTGGPSEYIDLQFVAIPNLSITGFLFVIEGQNAIVK